MPFISITASDDTLNRLALAVETLTAVLVRVFPPPLSPSTPPSLPTSPEEVSRLDLDSLADQEAEEDRLRALDEPNGYEEVR